MGFFDNRNYSNNSNTSNDYDWVEESKKSRRNTIVIFVVIIAAYLLYSMFGNTLFGGETSTGRTKLDDSKHTLTNLWYDADSEYASDDLQNAMISFYESSGVEPYLHVITDSKEYTEDELNEMAADYYANNLFTDTRLYNGDTPTEEEKIYDEAHMVIIFQKHEGNTENPYSVGIHVGTDGATVIDADAVTTFKSCLASAYSKYTGTNIFVNTFKDATSKIMGTSKSRTVVIIVLIAVCVLYFAYAFIKSGRKANTGNNNSANNNYTNNNSADNNSADNNGRRF